VHPLLRSDGCPTRSRYTTPVLNAFSELVLDVFGAERGTHARTAIGAATLPLNLPVGVAAELALAD
jgi:hypothetical protein